MSVQTVLVIVVVMSAALLALELRLLAPLAAQHADREAVLLSKAGR